MDEITPEVWLNAGYTKFDSGLRGNALYGLQKRITDETGICYFVNVWVFDFTPLKIGKRWGFQPEVQFKCEVTTDVAIHTDVPSVAEKTFADIWARLGKPYYETF